MTDKISEKSKNILSHVARNSIQNYLKDKQRTKYSFDIEELLEYRAVFVSLWGRISKELRGCIGHIEAVYPLVEAVSKTAISSALSDPRFKPLTLYELSDINIEISVLSSLNKISPEDIKIGKHGLLLIKGSNRSVFLPKVAISQGWNLKRLLDELSIKAGINKSGWKDRETELFYFESESWVEN